ncbi:MAG: glycosyltransferase family 2 protein, partial [Bacteroidota bacterium]
HMEEIDLCWRIKNEGFDIQYVGNSTVYHVGGATLNEYNPRKTFLNFKNSLVTILKNVPFPSVIFVIFARLILDGIAGIKFALGLKFNHTFAIIKAHFSFYWNIPRTLKKRVKISKKYKNYYHTFSIVWQYFIRSRKTFEELL